MNGNTLEILLAILGVLAGGLTLTFVLKIVVKRRRDSTKVTQRRNIVHGDQAGRDINKRK